MTTDEKSAAIAFVSKAGTMQLEAKAHACAHADIGGISLQQSDTAPPDATPPSSEPVPIAHGASDFAANEPDTGAPNPSAVQRTIKRKRGKVSLIAILRALYFASTPWRRQRRRPNLRAIGTALLREGLDVTYIVHP